MSYTSRRRWLVPKTRCARFGEPRALRRGQAHALRQSIGVRCFRRKTVVDKRDTSEICQWKGAEIIEGEVYLGHIHMLVCSPPKKSASGFMGYLKGIKIPPFGGGIFIFVGAKTRTQN